MMAPQQISLIAATWCGNCAFASGEGVLLHRNKRAINLLFGRKVLTLQTCPGVLSLSLILVGLPDLPEVTKAHFEGDVMSTDTFKVKTGSFEDLQFRRRAGLNTRNAARSLRPWIRPYDHSIAKAMLIYLYDLEVSRTGLERGS